MPLTKSHSPTPSSLTIQLTPTQSITNFPIGFGPINNIQLSSNTSWQQTNLIEPSSTEKSKQTAAGIIYDVLIQGTINHNSQELQAFLQTHSNSKFVVRCKDQTGIEKVYGSPDYPLQMEWEYKSGKKPSDPLKTLVKFRVKSPLKSRIYNP